MWGSSKKSNIRSVLRLPGPASEHCLTLTAHIGEEAGEQSDCENFLLLKAIFSVHEGDTQKPDHSPLEEGRRHVKVTFPWCDAVQQLLLKASRSRNKWKDQLQSKTPVSKSLLKPPC